MAAVVASPGATPGCRAPPAPTRALAPRAAEAAAARLASRRGPLAAAAAAPLAVLAAAARGPRAGGRRGPRGAPRARLAAARLHGAQTTRSPLVNWYCYEFGIPLDMLPPRPSPHPFGQVPCLVDDGGVEVFESGAILLYLADKYGGLDTPEQRARYTKWVVWANTSLEEVCFGPRFSGSELSKPGRALDVLEELLSSSDWLVGGEFSVADVAVASYLNYVPVFFGQQDLRGRPRIAAYMKRCADRPAFVQAFGEQHAGAVKSQILG